MNSLPSSSMPPMDAAFFSSLVVLQGAAAAEEDAIPEEGALRAAWEAFPRCAASHCRVTWRRRRPRGVGWGGRLCGLGSLGRRRWVARHGRVTAEGHVAAQHLTEFLVHWRRRQREQTGALRVLRPSNPQRCHTSCWLYDTASHRALGLLSGDL